jgi:hypothetical protein
LSSLSFVEYLCNKEKKAKRKKDGKISSSTPVLRRNRAPSSSGTAGSIPTPSLSSGGSSGGTMDQFDSLKREATKLERSLEDKVARYQQVSIPRCYFVVVL